MSKVGRQVGVRREQTMVSRAPGQVQPHQGAGSTRPPDALTPREQEILQLIWAGLTNRVIAEQLHISIKTGEAHRASMMRRLGVSNTALLLNLAVQKGLLVYSSASGDLGSPGLKQPFCTADGNGPSDLPALLRRSQQG